MTECVKVPCSVYGDIFICPFLIALENIYQVLQIFMNIIGHLVTVRQRMNIVVQVMYLRRELVSICQDERVCCSHHQNPVCDSSTYKPIQYTHFFLS